MAQSGVLTAQKRSKLGTRAARALRSELRIPANIQGEGLHVDFSIDEREFLTSRRAHVHLYDIDIEGETESAVVRELTWDTFGDRIIHIEFKKVQRGVETESEVALEFVGHPQTGVLNHLVTHVAVICLPSLIPDSLEVRIDRLEEGAHITVADLEMPEGVRLVVDSETEIATIIASKGHIMDEPEEESEEDEPEAPSETPEA